MLTDEYGLGVDIGDQNVLAAICRSQDDGGSAPEALTPAGAARFPSVVGVGADGRLSLGNPDDRAAEVCSAPHAMSRIGVPTPMYVAGRPVAAVDVVAAVVAELQEAAEAAVGAPASWTVVTVPPSWGSHRRGLLADALTAASRRPISLVPSTVAVTRSHLAAARLPDDATVVVYDLGASTLDCAVLRSTPTGSIEHLAVPAALAWGGRDVDDAVLGHVSRCLELPSRRRAADAELPDPAALRRQCIAAKEALSTDMAVDLTVALPSATRSVRVTREELDELIADSVAASVDLVRQAVADAGLDVADVAGILLAGGSSRIPLVAETLSAEFDRPLFAAADPGLCAALGAAALARDLGAAAAEVAAESEDLVVQEEAADADDADPPRRRSGRRGAHAAAAQGSQRGPGRTRRPGGRPDSRSAVGVGRLLSRGGVLAALFAVLLLVPVAVSAVLNPTLVDRSADQPVAEADEGPPAQSMDAATGQGGGAAPAAGLSPASVGQPATRGTAAAADRTRSSATGGATAVQSATPAAAAASTSVAPVPPTVPPTTLPPTVPPTTVPPTGPPTSDPPTVPPTTDPPTVPPTTEPPATGPPPVPPVEDPPGDPAPTGGTGTEPAGAGGTTEPAGSAA